MQYDTSEVQNLTASKDFEWSLGQLMMTVCTLRQGWLVGVRCVVVLLVSFSRSAFVPGDNTV